MQKVNVPGVGVFNFPDEATQQQIESIMREKVLPQFGIKLPTDGKSGFMPALRSGIDTAQGSLQSALGGIADAVGAKELRDSLYKQAEANRTSAESELTAPTTWEDVSGAYDNSGLMAALSKFPTYAAEGIGKNLPQMAVPVIAPIAGGVIGTAMGGPAGGALGVAAGLGAGFTSNMGLMAGQNIQRQMDEGTDPDKVGVGRAFSAAVPQAALETIADRVIAGPIAKAAMRTPVSKMISTLGKGAEAAAENSVKRMLVRTGVDVAKHGTKAAAAESATEYVQQGIERAQALGAGSVLTPEGFAEMRRAGIEGGIIGGLMGGVAGPFEGVAARRDIAAKKAQQEMKARLETEDRGAAPDRNPEMAASGIGFTDFGGRKTFEVPLSMQQEAQAEAYRKASGSDPRSARVAPPAPEEVPVAPVRTPPVEGLEAARIAKQRAFAAKAGDTSKISPPPPLGEPWAVPHSTVAPFLFGQASLEEDGQSAPRRDYASAPRTEEELAKIPKVKEAWEANKGTHESLVGRLYQKTVGTALRSAEGARHKAYYEPMHRLLTVSLASNNPTAQLEHEISHVVWTNTSPQEKKNLVTFAKAHPEVFPAARQQMYGERFAAAKQADPKFDVQDAMDDEWVAHLRQSVEEGKVTLAGKPRNIIDKAKREISNLGNSLRGMGYQQADDVLAAIDSGEIGMRHLTGMPSRPLGVVTGEREKDKISDTEGFVAAEDTGDKDPLEAEPISLEPAKASLNFVGYWVKPDGDARKLREVETHPQLAGRILKGELNEKVSGDPEGKLMDKGWVRVRSSAVDFNDGVSFEALAAGVNKAVEHAKSMRKEAIQTYKRIPDENELAGYKIEHVNVPFADIPEFLDNPKKYLARTKKALDPRSRASLSLDDDGKPVGYYHGTTEAFEDFRPGKHKRKMQFGFGIHFTTDPEVASMYADELKTGKGKFPNVHKVNLDYNKLLDTTKMYNAETDKDILEIHKELYKGTGRSPYITKDGDFVLNVDVASPQKAERIIKERGYDAIKYDAVNVIPSGYGLRKGKTYPSIVVFDNKQIRPAYQPPEDGSSRASLSDEPITGKIPEADRSRYAMVAAAPKPKPLMERLFGVSGNLEEVTDQLKAKMLDQYYHVEIMSKKLIEQGYGELTRADRSSIVALRLLVDRAMQFTNLALTDGVISYDKEAGLMRVLRNKKNEAITPDGKLTKGLIKDLTATRNGKEINLMDLSPDDLVKVQNAWQAVRLNPGRYGRQGKGIPVEKWGQYGKDDWYFKQADTFIKENPWALEMMDKYNVHNKALVKLLLDTGVITQKTHDNWTESPYSPFYRNLEEIEKDSAFEKTPSLKNVKFGHPFKGGEAPVDDLIENITKNISAAVGAATRNVAMRRVLRDASVLGEVTPVPARAKAANPVTIRIDGKAVHFDVKDSDLLLMLQSRPQFDSGFSKLIAESAGWLRKGITAAPPFWIANVIRDTGQNMLTSGYDINPLRTASKGIYNSFKKGAYTFAGKEMQETPWTQALHDMGISGGINAVRGDGKTKVNLKRIFRRSSKEGFAEDLMSGKFINAVSLLAGRAWEATEAASERSDLVVRAKVFEEAWKANKGKPGAEAQAAYEALETLNFSRHGSDASVRWITMAVPFMNARFQGLDVMQRAARGKAANQLKTASGKAQTQARFIKTGFYMAASTLSYAMVMPFFSAYRNANDEERDGYWFVPLDFTDPESVCMRIPIPFEVGAIFKSLPERLWNTMADQKEDGSGGQDLREDLGKFAVRTFLSTFQMNPLPQIVKPAIEVVFNQNFYQGRKIEPAYLEGLAPEYRYTEQTSEASKLISKALLGAASPVQIDHLIRGYFGSIGSYLVDLSGAAIEMFDTEHGEKADAPLLAYKYGIGRFYQRPEGSGKINKFYSAAEDVSQVFQSYMKLMERGDVEEAQKIAEKSPEKIAANDYFSAIKQALGEVRSDMRRVNSDKTMSGEEKKDLLEKLRLRQIELTKDIYNVRREIRRQSQ
jgi:hypothetical protein